mgnify:CR=1 FL=1
MLNDHLFCNRRAALKIVEGWRSANEHTERGDIVHEHADLAGYESVRQSEISNPKLQIILLRALPVWSERLGLNGKCDVVEAELCSVSTNLKSEISDLKLGGIAALRPVEFKLGKRRQWENDDAQLCAQALCLEEMFDIRIERGAVFHAKSKRRREVVFTDELRETTEQAIRELHELVHTQHVPPPVYKKACLQCSLHDICLPEMDGGGVRDAARALYVV